MNHTMAATIIFCGCMFIANALAQENNDWPLRPDRNVISSATNLPVTFPPESVRWKIKRPDSWFFSVPVVRGNRVFFGSNSATIHDPDLLALSKTPKHPLERGGNILCLDLATGNVIWELPTPRATRQRGHNTYGVCSPVVIEGNRLYVVDSAGCLLCLDINGMADGNAGPVTDELAYLGVPTAGSVTNKATQPKPTWGDIIWRYDIAGKHNVLLHDAYACTVLVLNNQVWVTTTHSRGATPAMVLNYQGTEVQSQAEDHEFKPYPDPVRVPNLLVLDARDGTLLAMDNVTVPHIFHGQWCSPAAGTVNGRTLVFWGDGYGILHAFLPPVLSQDGTPVMLKEQWSFDTNPPSYRTDENGKEKVYNAGGSYKIRDVEGPAEIVCTPVFDNGRVYIAFGRDPHHGEVKGALYCLDAATGRLIWSTPRVSNSESSVAVTDDLIFATDTLGTLNCLDKATGLTIWEHKVGPVWFASPLVADGKVYVANNIGRMTVLAASREKKVLGSVKTGLSAITPAVAKSVVIVGSCGSLVCYSSQPTLPADAAKAQLPSTPATQVRQVAPKTGEGVQ